MIRNYKRVLIIEKGERELSEIEKVCCRLQDSFKEFNTNNRLLFNYKFNGKFEKKGFKNSFKLRTKIPLELAQELHSYYNQNPVEELNALLRENIEGEVVNAVLKEMYNDIFNIKSFLIEKKEYYNTESKSSFSVSVKKFFNRIAKIYASLGYELIVSVELLEFLECNTNYRITNEKPEYTNFAMGLQKVGYYLTDNNVESYEMPVYMNPYSPADKCLIVKNLRNPEFFVTLNTEGMVYDPSMFAPTFNNHEAHFNIPNNVSYRAFRINGVQAFI